MRRRADVERLVGRRRPVRHRARHLHRRHQRAAHHRRSGSAAACSAATPNGSRASACCMRSRRTTSRASETPTDGYNLLKAEISHTAEAARTRRPASARDHRRRRRQQSAQRGHPQPRLLHQGRGADAGRERARVREREVLTLSARPREAGLRAKAARSGSRVRGNERSMGATSPPPAPSRRRPCRRYLPSPENVPPIGTACAGSRVTATRMRFSPAISPLVGSNSTQPAPGR